MKDLLGVAMWGAAAGIVAFVVAHHNVRGDARIKLTKWCLGVGVISIFFFIVNALIDLKIIPSRSTLGFGFVGMPALVLGVLLSVTDAIGNRRRTDGSVHKRSWVDYLMLWPLLLDANKNERDGRFLTKREWFGWSVVALLIICAIIFT